VLATTVPRQIKDETGKTNYALPATGSNADSVNSGTDSTLFVSDLVNSVADLVKSVTDLTLFVTDLVNCVTDLVKLVADVTLSGSELVWTDTESIPSNPSKVTGALEKIASPADKTALPLP